MEHVYEVNWNAVAVMAAVMVAVAIISWPSTREWIRGRKMKQQRRQEIQGDFLFWATDYVEEMVAAEKLTRAEANDEIYVLLKRVFHHRDIYPSQPILKERIIKRMASGVNAPVELPKEEPVPVVVVQKVVKRKNLLDK